MGVVAVRPWRSSSQRWLRVPISRYVWSGLCRVKGVSEIATSHTLRVGLQQVLVGPRMMLDHMPDRVLATLRKVVDNLGSGESGERAVVQRERMRERMREQAAGDTRV